MASSIRYVTNPFRETRSIELITRYNSYEGENGQNYSLVKISVMATISGCKYSAVWWVPPKVLKNSVLRHEEVW